MSVLLIIKLKGIVYSGENIGDDMSFQFDVKGQVTHVKTKISFGEHKSFNKVLFQETFAEGSISLPISVDITEEDSVFNDTGSGSSNLKVQLQESETQMHSFNANVIASGGDKGKTATFTFIMEADVENVLKADFQEAIVGHGESRPLDLLDKTQKPYVIRTAQNDAVRILGDLDPQLDRDVSWAATAGDMQPTSAHNDDVSVFTPSSTDPVLPDQATVTLTYTVKGTSLDKSLLTRVAVQELVQVLFGEAATTDPIATRRAIADVIRNRVSNPLWPNTYVDVILQAGQFGAVGGELYNGSVSRHHLLEDLGWVFNCGPYDDSVKAACEIFSNEIGPQAGGCIGYFAPMVGDDGTSQWDAINTALQNRDTRSAEKIVPAVVKRETKYSYPNVLAGVDEQIVIVPIVQSTVFVREKPGPDVPGVVNLSQ